MNEEELQLLRDVRERVIRIEERITAVPDHETRIRSLEVWRWSLVGFVGLLTTFTTAYTTLKTGSA